MATKTTGSCPREGDVIRILHVSDTHNHHEGIEKEFPRADILFHTGDWTQSGTDAEHDSFNKWCKKVKPRFEEIVVIAGNHDFPYGSSPTIDAECIKDDYIIKRITNARVLRNETFDFHGLKLYGCPWLPWWASCDPSKPSKSTKRCQNRWKLKKGAKAHRYDEIPEGVDILLTHSPAAGIFDNCVKGDGYMPYGSSKELTSAIKTKKPKAHLHGHLHEQRGQWLRDKTGNFSGGCEYRTSAKSKPFSTPTPPKDYPCDLVSCNAMENHPTHEGDPKAPKRIVGPARLIVATFRGGRWHFTAEPASAGVKEGSQVRILHISDTHTMHASIEKQFPFPRADILLHTGDFTNNGTEKEFQMFDKFCEEMQKRFDEVIVISGNHEYRGPQTDAVKCASSFIGARLKHARVLHHETFVYKDLRIFGSAWVPWHDCGAPDRGDTPDKTQYFDKIPRGIDILMTHGPAHGVFDMLEGSKHYRWGSSKKLRAAIYRAKPRAHLCGHVHEQRGQWLKKRKDGDYVGGAEYPTSKPTYSPKPSSDYPCHLISSNAMKNHGGMDGLGPHIAGPARLITATFTNGQWHFEARPTKSV